MTVHLYYGLSFCAAYFSVHVGWALHSLRLALGPGDALLSHLH